MARREPYTLRQMRWLHAQYAKSNKRYWAEELPADVRIIVVPAGRVGLSIDCRFKPNSRIEEGTTTTITDLQTGEHLVIPTIELNELIMSYIPFAKSVLLHEMIHVSGVGGHGKAFKAEVERISKLGALLEVLT